MTKTFHLGAIPIEDIEIGMTLSYSQTITDSDIKAFAGLSGDHNPIHVDEKYAENSRFKKRIAHGLMSAGFFSQLFGTKLPGPGCVYTSQSLKFLRPVYINDTVTATVEVINVDISKKRVTFRTFCTVNNKKVIDGEAEIYIP
ncbi:MaoC family dehydratase [Lonepinella koalarum]|uniref:3-hydroxybutyryl-CoA dehydratase n=1 Tax=Lonepinella koalarum TaxID=53417 RepID=A0A4V2PUK2_9PAST|nr:MaoC family dehydratase [Lonepinella koalarum]MDH2926810.1 acyl dehydratase [Lonepinella koalarum]TCK70531.1 3-hydroxybutyryl-CoA dehydratase [Lonepinella koalarum]TFJ90088.1 MaoC family dehydratase [Lonepinella koalarum]